MEFSLYYYLSALAVQVGYRQHQPKVPPFLSRIFVSAFAITHYFQTPSTAILLPRIKGPPPLRPSLAPRMPNPIPSRPSAPKPLLAQPALQRLRRLLRGFRQVA